ncbi:MAG: hypothetical protein FWF50_02340 [Defluviitaleaceae bacterium]|nr:hypothetical protein [Defluviitaleaceae bacterium]
MIKTTLINSYKELKELSILNGFKIYGNNVNPTNRFEIIEDFDFKLGVAYYHHGINSSIVKLKTKNIIFLGFEQSLIEIDFKQHLEMHSKNLNSIFYEFIETDTKLLAICELDIIAFDFDGKIVWETSFMDIVENYEINKNVIIVYSGAQKIEVNLNNGHHISTSL